MYLNLTCKWDEDVAVFYKYWTIATLNFTEYAFILIKIIYGFNFFLIIIDQSIQDELFLDFDFYLFEQWANMFHYNVLIS
ncbi:hypothetical protein DYY65_05855 [Nitrososphaera sp. AFS]|nr:hypothetical protein [Nitrososphaera sp. AFS]